MTSRLDEIKARWAKATPGPWGWAPNPHGGARVQKPNAGIADVLWRAGVEHPVQQSCEANADAIAHAPDDVAYLLRELDARTAALADTVATANTYGARLDAIETAVWNEDWTADEVLRDAYDAGVAAERERCAKLLDERSSEVHRRVNYPAVAAYDADDVDGLIVDELDDIADAIREGGEK
jgi:hypothetical protein